MEWVRKEGRGFIEGRSNESRLASKSEDDAIPCEYVIRKFPLSLPCNAVGIQVSDYQTRRISWKLRKSSQEGSRRGLVVE